MSDVLDKVVEHPVYNRDVHTSLYHFRYKYKPQVYIHPGSNKNTVLLP